jgi:hypothetical protein
MQAFAGLGDAASLGYGGQKTQVSDFELYIHDMSIVHLFGGNKQ